MNLHYLTVEALTELTNVGTVRRASKDMDTAITWSKSPDGLLIAEADDGTRCVLGPGPFDDWECSCPAMYRCRHLVRAVLHWQRDNSDAPAMQAPAASDGKATPVALFPSRLRTKGDLLASGGITARVTTVPRLRVRLLHPLDIGVRYPIGTDPSYARCECGAPVCVHLYLAERARELAASGLAGASAVLVDTTPPQDDRVDPAPWHAWLAQFLDVGLGAADAMIGGAVRLATTWEGQGRVHPAAALREIVTQLEHHRAHDAQLSPERLLLLIGEVEARLRALGFDGPAPHAVVAGRPDAEVTGESARLLGLGAEWLHVGGWNALRVFLMDVRTGAVLTLDAERDDTTEKLVVPADLLARRNSGAALADWAVGNALVPRFRRRGDRLAIGRTRVSVVPSATLDLAGLAAVLPEGFIDVAAQLSGVPGPLGPRRPADGVLACPVAGVHEVWVDAAASTVRATLTDASGEQAALVLPWGTRTAAGARRLIGLLDSGELTAVAGRWRTGEDGLSITPTAVWTSAGVLLPQVDLALGCDPSGPAQLPVGAHDPWRLAWESVAEPMGRLLVLGGRRGAAIVAPDLERAATTAESSGLSRLSELARSLSISVGSTDQRRKPFAEACVLLSFAD